MYLEMLLLKRQSMRTTYLKVHCLHCSWKKGVSYAHFLIQYSYLFQDPENKQKIILVFKSHITKSQDIKK